MSLDLYIKKCKAKYILRLLLVLCTIFDSHCRSNFLWAQSLLLLSCWGNVCAHTLSQQSAHNTVIHWCTMWQECGQQGKKNKHEPDILKLQRHLDLWNTWVKASEDCHIVLEDTAISSRSNISIVLWLNSETLPKVVPVFIFAIWMIS